MFHRIYIDVVSKDDIKKKFRDVIFVEDESGNLVKYARCKPKEMAQRSTNPSAKPNKKSSKKSTAKPNKKTSKKLTAKPIEKTIATTVPPMKPYENMASEMTVCYVHYIDCQRMISQKFRLRFV